VTEPRLVVDEPSGPAHGIALVLHGGRSKSRDPVCETQLAVLRMRPFAAALRRAGGGLVVARLLYRLRGWNGVDRAPVADTQWALNNLAMRFPGQSIALVGHSMGARAAIYAAAHDRVRAIVALAPWIEAGDPVATLAARRVLIAHGDQDRMTDPSASRDYARAAERVAETVSYVRVAGERHAMLRRPRVWTELTVGFVLGALLDAVPPGRGDAGARRAVTGALAGQAAIDV
jgi:alpha-beta hydrolase superfamily lysophospholipase